MTLVKEGYLHYTDMNKFLKNLLLGNNWSDFTENFDSTINMTLVNWGNLHYKDMKKFLKNFLL